MSAFALEDSVVYHVYSTYARGLDGLWGMYQWLDRAPKGRNETGPWWRHHDCQCRDCQRESGTGHGSHLTFPRIGVKLKGEAKHWDMVGDSGNVKTRALLPHLRVTGIYDVCGHA